MANCIGMFTQLELIFRSSIFKNYAMVEITGKSRRTVLGTVYQKKSSILFYTLYFMEISLSISVKPARGYIQVSKSTCVWFVLVISTIMLYEFLIPSYMYIYPTLVSYCLLHVHDIGQCRLCSFKKGTARWQTSDLKP